MDSIEMAVEHSKCETLHDPTRGWSQPCLTYPSCFYPLSSNSKNFPAAQLPHVLDRLASVIRMLSLATTFHNSPIEATCRSLEQMEFVVSVWSDRTNNNMAIVEIQKVHGNSVTFSHYSRKIMAAIFDPTAREIQTTSTQRAVMPNEEVSDAILRCSSPVEQSPVSDALDLTLSLLLTDRADSQCLGLESLSILTDPTKTGLSVAKDIAKAALLGIHMSDDGTTVAGDYRIRDRILYLALLKRWPGARMVNADLHEHDKAHSYLAMRIIANALNLLTDPADISAVLDAAKEVTGTTLIGVLEDHVWNAWQEPHEAYWATMILNSICLGQPKIVHDASVMDAIQSAQLVGRYSHAALERAVGGLLMALEVV